MLCAGLNYSDSFILSVCRKRDMNFAMSDIIIKYKLKRILNYTNVNQYSPTAQIAFIDSSIFGNPFFLKLSLVSIIKRVLLNNCYTLHCQETNRVL